MLYANYVREKTHNLIRYKELSGYPLVLVKSKGEYLKDYKIYGNSIQDGTPAPETPIEVESVGEKTNNLAKNHSIVNTLNIYANALQIKADLQPSTTYAFSFKGAVGNQYYINEGLFKGYRSFTVKDGVTSFTATTLATLPTTSPNLTNNGYLVLKNLVTQPNSHIFEDVMVTLGTEVIPYEPYGYKIPVKTKSKNIFDYNYYFENIEATAEAIRGTKFQLKPNTRYTLSTNIEFNKYANAFVKTTNTMPSTSQNGFYEGQPRTITTGSNGILYIMTRTSKTANYEIVVTLDDFKNGIYWIQLEENKIQTNYEPFIEPITTNIYIDEPLRKIGDYADYIDFKTRKIVRRVGEKILKGSDGNWSSTVTWGDHAFFIPNLKNMLSWGTAVGALCSHLQSYTGKTTTTLSNQWVIGGSNIVLSNENCLTSAELKTWLNENDVRITYPLNTPEEETIELPNIPTIKGTTIIEIDTNIQPSNMWVKYVAK